MAFVLPARAVNSAPAPGVVSTRTCAVKSDFKKVYKRMTKAKVARILHNKGHRVWYSKKKHKEKRTYRTCSSWRGSSISIIFTKGRVSWGQARWRA
ncbi:MAG: hypothetical protein WCF04_01990 [Candidatus Nanopelagicales bacterium]